MHDKGCSDGPHARRKRFARNNDGRPQFSREAFRELQERSADTVRMSVAVKTGSRGLAGCLCPGERASSGRLGMSKSQIETLRCNKRCSYSMTSSARASSCGEMVSASDPLDARLGFTKRCCRAKNGLTRWKSYFRTASAKKASCVGARSGIRSPDCVAVS